MSFLSSTKVASQLRESDAPASDSTALGARPSADAPLDASGTLTQEPTRNEPNPEPEPEPTKEMSVLTESPNTPMMQQYLSFQKEHPDHILLFRVGDFFEMFFQDAIDISAKLGLTLTKRTTTTGHIPMCGIPASALDTYIPRLIHHGFRLAVCDQVGNEENEESKDKSSSAPIKKSKLFNRDIVRLITAGTLTEPHLLKDDQPNYILCAHFSAARKVFSLCWTDITLGEIRVKKTTIEQFDDDLSRLTPREILIHEDALEEIELYDLLGRYKKLLQPLPAHRFDFANATRTISETMRVPDIETLGNFSQDQWCAIGVMIGYLRTAHRDNVLNIHRFIHDTVDNRMVLDATTIRHLELTQSFGGEKAHGMLAHMGKPQSSAGKRCLRQYLLNPSCDIPTITRRQDAIAYFTKSRPLIDICRKHIVNVADIERASARLVMNRWTINDLIIIKQSLISCLGLHKEIEQYHTTQHVSEHKQKESTDQHDQDDDDHHNDLNPTLINRALGYLDSLHYERDLLQRALVEHHGMGAKASDSLVIRNGFRSDLDQLRQAKNQLAYKVQELTARYREHTGVNTLHIKNNDALGFFVEVPKKHAAKLSLDLFKPRQALTQVARFDTTDLANIGHTIFAAQERASQLEREIIQDIVDQLVEKRTRIQHLSHAVGFLDWATTQAHVALERGYTRPVVDDSTKFVVDNGRHVVVENILNAKQHSKTSHTTQFHANDCHLNPHECLWLITGPNMAGKSTFLRQNALITLLAHGGFYVPADRAHIGLVDRIFTRVGASDNLPSGQSTFMVEMNELSVILRQSSQRSLLIIDEVGRGTSTFDGLAIAWACIEYIHDTVGARTLFATHYHELGQLMGRLPRLQSYRVKTSRVKDQLIFSHQIVSGLATQSFGIDVALMAGLPDFVIARARHMQKVLQNKAEGPQGPLLTSYELTAAQKAVYNEIQSLDLESIDPNHIKNIIKQWQQLLISQHDDSSSQHNTQKTVPQ